MEAARVPVPAGAGGVHQRIGVVRTPAQRVHRDHADPGRDRYGEQGQEGGEGPVEVVGDQHEVDAAGEHQHHIEGDSHGARHPQPQRDHRQPGGVGGEMVRHQQPAEGRDQIGDRHPGRQHRVDGGDRVGGGCERRIARGEQRAERDQQHERDARAERRGHNQPPARNLAGQITGVVRARVGPADTGTGGDEADARDHAAGRTRRGVEHLGPVDGRGQEAHHDQIEDAEDDRGPLVDPHDGGVAETADQQRADDEDQQTDEREHGVSVDTERGAEQREQRVRRGGGGDRLPADPAQPGDQGRTRVAPLPEDGAGEGERRRAALLARQAQGPHQREGAEGAYDGDENRLPDVQAAEGDEGGAEREPEDADICGEPGPEHLAGLAVPLVVGDRFDPSGLNGTDAIVRLRSGHDGTS